MVTDDPARVVSNMVNRLREGMSLDEVVAQLGRPTFRWSQGNDHFYLIYHLHLGTNVARRVPCGLGIDFVKGRVVSWSVIFGDVGLPQ